MANTSCDEERESSVRVGDRDCRAVSSNDSPSTRIDYNSTQADSSLIPQQNKTNNIT